MRAKKFDRSCEDRHAIPYRTLAGPIGWPSFGIWNLKLHGNVEDFRWADRWQRMTVLIQASPDQADLSIPA
jgi:hypothetical protein